jgi:adenylate kinase
MRLVLIGPPGSGKGTQAQELVKRLGLTYIGTGEILRDAIGRKTEMGKRVEPIIKQGRLVPDEIVNQVVADLFHGPNRPERFVTDGYPRTEAQAHAFDALLRQEYLALTAVVHLTITDDEVVRRMLDRKREDDNEETIRERLREFHRNTDKLVEHYRRQCLVRDVPATGPKEEVYANIEKVLGVPAKDSEEKRGGKR